MTTDWAWKPEHISRKRPMPYGAFDQKHAIDFNQTAKMKSSCEFPTLLVLRGQAPVLTHCSKCSGCQARKKLIWANKIDLERLGWPHSHFITLTYSDENLYYVDAPTDQHPDRKLSSVSKRDIDLFTRRLSINFKRAGCKDRYAWYLCAEYGSASLRPHYHMVLFCNYSFDQISDLVHSSWSHGFVHFGPSGVRVGASSYVSDYLVKKSVRDEQLAREQEREFHRYSRRPALGRSGLDVLVYGYQQPGPMRNYLERFGDISLEYLYNDFGLKLKIETLGLSHVKENNIEGSRNITLDAKQASYVREKLGIHDSEGVIGKGSSSLKSKHDKKSEALEWLVDEYNLGYHPNGYPLLDKATRTDLFKDVVNEIRYANRFKHKKHSTKRESL